jgi:uncharacterized protein (TIGR04255 family)
MEMAETEGARIDFDNPPVVETVLSAQFDKLTAMQAVHFGLFWRKMQAGFPMTEEHPPLSPVVERFGEPILRGARMQFEVMETPAPARLWLLNEPRNEMIQVQNDRFIKNWRKASEADQYPRYERTIKPAFYRDFAKFQAFLEEENLGIVKVNQCEVTYVNHIVSGYGWQSLREIHRIFTFWNEPSEPMPGGAEELAMQARFPINFDQGEPIGRLHVEVQPALRASDHRPMYVMTLTARGFCGTDFDFFDIGRRWIVESFVRLTTDYMHQIWRKK